MRVPTYSSYMSLLNQTMNTKSQVELYAFQANTGLKAPTYAGYGMNAYNIVNLEATSQVTSNFLENNKLLNIEIKTMSTSMEAIDKSLSQFKSLLTSTSGMDLGHISPDYTGGEITFTSNEDVYLGKTITLDGKTYTFAGNGDGNNIDISTLTAGSDDYAAEVMAALEAKVGSTNPDFTFDGATFKFPLYTVNGASSVLNAEGVTTGEPHTMSTEQYQNLQQLQLQAFATLQMLTDALNVSANGKYLFGGGVSNQAPVNFPFSSLEEFQQYYDGVDIKYPDSRSADLSNRSISDENISKLTMQKIEGNQGVLTAEPAGGFLTEAMSATAETTGTLTFSQKDNSIHATQYGAFSTLKAGDSLVLGDATSDSGESYDGFYIVKSISEDGRTVTFETTENSKSIPADGTITDGDNARFSTTFPISSVVEMDGFDKNIATRIQITGVSDDGSQLYFTADPARIPDAATEIGANSKWEMKTESYYQGGDFKSEKRITENQSLMFDVTANNPAFEKLFRALGQIAQGNIVDTRNPADDFDGLLNTQNTKDIVSEAMNLIQNAIYNSGNTNGDLNSDIYTVTAKINANYVVLDSANTNLTQVQNNLETSISSLKNVDKTEASVKALMALNDLNASYSVLQGIMNTSLLNYLK